MPPRQSREVAPPAARQRAAARRAEPDNNDDEAPMNDDQPTRGRPGEARRAAPKPVVPAEPEFVSPRGGKSSQDLVVVMKDIDPKKNSVRFNATDKDAAITSVYINNNGIPNRDYTGIKITVEFLK